MKLKFEENLEVSKHNQESITLVIIHPELRVKLRVRLTKLVRIELQSLAIISLQAINSFF